MATKISRPLAESWRWKKRNLELDLKSDFSLDLSTEAAQPSLQTLEHAWVTSKVPSEIHVELLTHGLIPDPYIGFGEHHVQWIGEVEWLYKCSFSVETAAAAFLTFEGLDTICDIYLNDQKIVEAENMFLAYEHQLDLSTLKETNTLVLHFKSAKSIAKELEATYGKVRAGSTNLGDPSRVYVRKAQYGWRWDWGPELMTVGPYRPITLTTIHHPIHIEDVWAQSWLSAGDPHVPSLGVVVTLARPSQCPEGYSVEVSLIDADDERTVKTANVPIAQSDTVQLAWPDLTPENVEAWWPAGMGKQKLYGLDVRLLSENAATVDWQGKRIGFRSARLVEDPLEDADQYGKGTTFFFEINGERMFQGGSNWIPADNFLTTLTPTRYRDWLTLLRDGNQTMVRIWGGGIYEPDVFYDLCDELGLLVWQDFQFACGVYPGVSSAKAADGSFIAPAPFRAFVENVKREAEYNVKRLRHHASIAVWCGNNEDYQMVLQWGDVPHLPATVIYEEVLPSVVSSLTSFQVHSSATDTESITTVQTSYVRGSPYGGKGWDTADPTVGDVHQWNIWGGKELPYQEYGRMGGRFVSEFGIPSFPSLKTVEHWMKGLPREEWYAQSKAMAQHVRAGAYERRFAIVMNENFRNVDAGDFDKYQFNTQVMQAEAVGYAYQVWRREWRGKGKEYCGGVLVWQFNDCWPVASWALVDYFMRPKPVYYAIKRQLAPITVNILREVVKNRDNDRPKQFYEYGATRSLYANLHVWATNATREAIQVKLVIEYFDLESDWQRPDYTFSLESQSEASLFTLLPNQTTELKTLICPSPAQSKLRDLVGPGIDGSGTVVILARLLLPDTGEVIARSVDWPQPYRYLHIPKSRITTDWLNFSPEKDQATLFVDVDKPVKCLWLEIKDPSSAQDKERGDRRVWLSDNAMDLVPGETQMVLVKGLKGLPDEPLVTTRYLEG
ncbi:beta-mannosidase [Coprinopsis sp. MPI-PUGE-AT-0042]|nr:beta-mannosidase [Coprinopsis sp. MPI-PUGE-AT-0042]